ncbi:hypothetical protein MBLNU230_g4299t1 [Neophaeotheca triangularis]
MPQRVDVHSHFLPPFYRKACEDNGHANPDGMPAVPQWSPEAHLDLMDKVGIKKSYLSVSTPGTNLVFNNRELAAKITRDCNSYAANLKKDNPSRFGTFANLPIPDVDLCLEEIENASAEGCDGFTVLTNGHGYYLGDSMLDPIFAELNKRKAVLFIHPTTPCAACGSSQAETGETQPKTAVPFDTYPRPMLEFFFDAARAVTSLFMSGTVSRCPDIKFILPHLGGAMPPLLSRWTGFSQLVPGPWEGVSEEQVREALGRQFWFDMAGFPFPGQIVGLVQGSGISHERLLYGSDFPFTKADGVEMLKGKMDAGMKGMFSDEQISDVYYRNAERLLGGS